MHVLTLTDDDYIIALSLGMKKPWIRGMEYYIDQFCVKVDWQGKGFPSENFYIKNGFSILDELIVLAK